MSNFGDIAANTDTSTLFAPSTNIPQSSITGAPSGALVGTTDPQTLSSKRINPRTATSANPSSVTPNADTTDLVYITGQAQALTINAPTGTPVEGQVLKIRIIDTGAGQTLTFNAAYQGTVSLALPATTLGSATASLIAQFEYDSSVSKWRLVRLNK